ncbi:glycoside hydrolase family 3 protein [Atractiella rhizophila]|nr:glycoside hydrolase family 3 protein [Atractiella rhizophila]
MVSQSLILSLVATSFAADGFQRHQRTDGVGIKNIQLGEPDQAPPGYEEWTSPLVLPSPPQTGNGGWEEAHAKALKFVNKLTLEEKVNLTTVRLLLQRCWNRWTVCRCDRLIGEITRLGFKGFCLEDGPLGVRLADYVSAFPAAINAAATWSKDLIYKRAVAMGQEFRGKGINVHLGPMMNLGRVAAGGRNWEGWGADPSFAGIAAALHIKGVQEQGVIANAKHFVGNEQEHYRGGSGGQTSSSNIDDRTMHEVYAWPFAESVHAGVGSIMCSYNRINQTHACENSKIINGLAKDELDFQGFMLSDWAAMVSGVNSALAGTDMNMPGFTAYDGRPSEPNPTNTTHSYWGSALIEAVRNGSVPEARVTDMVVRTMSAYYKLGQDKNYPHLNFNYNFQDTYDKNGALVNEHINVQDDHYKIIRDIGAASTVLLKNVKKALPLNEKKFKRIAVIGSDAGPAKGGPNGFSDRGGDEGTLAMGWGSGTANFPYLIDPLAAIQSYMNAHSPSTPIDFVLDDFNYGQIRAVARQAEVCLVFANSDSGEGYITVDGNAGDRNNLTLWHAGNELIKTTASECDNTVVIMHNVGPVDVEAWINHKNVTAVLAAGLPGQESGNAIVDILFGKVNPSGRTPYTWAKKRSDYNADVLYDAEPNTIPQITYKEKLNIDYRYFDAKNIAPRFEFGFGLSYTTFSYSNLKVKKVGPTSAPAQIVKASGGPTYLYDDAYTASFKIKNTGSSDGNEVYQLYLEYPKSAQEPPKVLRDFDRVFIKKGQTEQVSLKLRAKDISIWDVVAQKWTIPKGKYTVHIGSSSRDIRLQSEFTI